MRKAQAAQQKRGDLQLGHLDSSSAQLGGLVSARRAGLTIVESECVVAPDEEAPAKNARGNGW